MKKPSFQKLFDNKRFIIPFALVLSMLLWVAVAMTSMDVRTRTIEDVPVDVNFSTADLKNLGLHPIESETKTVMVDVRGQRTTIATLTPADLTLALRVSNITEPGTFEVPLTAAGTNEGYEIVRIAPASIKVRFDRFDSKTFEIKPRLETLTAPGGFALDEPYVTPQRVTLNGPQAELDKVAQCVLDVAFTDPLERTYSETHPIVLLDVKGEPLDPAELHLSMDITEADLIVPVLRIKVLPFEISFLNVPLGFPEEALRRYMHMTNYYTTVAGPVSIVNTYTDLRLGYIDLRELTPSENIYSFEVIMPSQQFQNLDGVNSVAVNFDTTDWGTQHFNLTNFQTSNMPSQYDVTVLTKALYNVPFVGLARELEGMTADDIIVELDFSEREITAGQHNFPVKISAPAKGLVWSSGEHSVIIQVTELS